MPKLRKLKDYEEIKYNGSESYCEGDNQEKSDGESDESKTSKISSREVFIEPAKGWLSSANIISNISDKRIKTAINHYQTLITLLEEELSLREMGVKSHLTKDINRSWRFSVQADDFDGEQDFSFELESGQSKKNFRSKRQRVREQHKFTRQSMAIKRFLKKQASLTKAQRSLLFEEWVKLL